MMFVEDDGINSILNTLGLVTSLMLISAFLVAKKGSLDGSLTRNRSVEDGWHANGSDFSGTQQNRNALFLGFKIDSLMENIRDLPDVRSMLVSHTKHMTDCLRRVSGGLFPR